MLVDTSDHLSRVLKFNMLENVVDPIQAVKTQAEKIQKKYR